MKLIRASLVVALPLAYFLSVFHFPDAGFFNAGLGDWVDPYFINYLLEHWHHSFWTWSDPASPPMYFPVRGTLGYSHGLILYAPFYVAARLVLHPFQAYNVTLFLVLLAGSLSLYLLLRRGLGLGFLESVLLSAFFYTSRNVVNGGAGHWSQRSSVFLIPLVLLFVFVSARMREGRSRLILGGLAGLSCTLLFTQDFYTAQLALLVIVLLVVGLILLARRTLERAARQLWHAAIAVQPEHEGRFSRPPSRWWLLTACLMLAWAVIVLLHPFARRNIGPLPLSATDPTRPLLIALLSGGWFAFRLERTLRHSPAAITLRGFEDIVSLWRSQRPYLFAFALGSLVGCLVFLWIYAGAYREHREFPADQLMSSLVELEPAQRPGSSGVMTALRAYDSLRPFKLVFLVAMIAWLPWFRVDKTSRLWCLWLMVVSFVILLLPLKLYDFSIWKSFIAPFPGFSVIRDPKRIAPVYDLAVVLLTGVLLTRLPRRSLLRVGIAALLLVLLITEPNPEGFGFGRLNDDYDRWVAAPIEIDALCQSFFIKGASEAYMARSFHMWSLYNVDAMFVSLSHSIPTLNGYSAWAPDEWGLANPQRARYSEAVDRWIARHQLRGVCEFDIEQRTMKPYIR